uniref:cytochrome P450 n=1 Tax=Nocardia pseudovaccinii TaxID=189540 RepID=UPI0035A21E6E
MAFPRIATEDMQIAGTSITAGDIVLVSLSAANRDPVLGADMDCFDPARSPAPHIAFGYGIHRCVGAELARMELRTAFPALISRFPNLRLAVAPHDLAFREQSIVYGLQTLPVLTHLDVGRQQPHSAAPRTTRGRGRPSARGPRFPLRAEGFRGWSRRC